jgi:uncharacterized protein YyaL (SSP411 family)
MQNLSIEQGTRFVNHLSGQASPYLLQHVHNPVNWYPWGEEAFAKAAKENKPIFLSIGYATCHWCHVMAHESFEDQEVADLMNEAFVSIKVDREERPDIDGVYMTVAQMLTGSGGWPLTIIMTPDKKPFFGGTYYPKHSRQGRIGMVDLIPRIKEIWTNQKDKALESADSLVEAIQRSTQTSASGIEGKELDAATLDLAFMQLRDRFDFEKGGFGDSPKFPTPHNLIFLLRYSQRLSHNQNAQNKSLALKMVERTLRAMRLGGIFDHVGFGFHRYSTDADWLLPHFEKMLYDQAMLALACIEACEATYKDEYKQIAKEIFEYVLRDMQSPEGGFYSAEDADSEGEEGKFYVWTKKEIFDLLENDLANLLCQVYEVYEKGNFLEEATREKTGANILHLPRALDEIAIELKMPLPEFKDKLETARQKLFALRKERIHPLKDDKILIDWNGLMIAALAKAYSVFGEEQYLQAAEKAVDFIQAEMTSSETIDPERRLFHCIRFTDKRIQDKEKFILKDAFLDDYAFLIAGLLELYQASFKVEYLQRAIDLCELALKYYQDHEQGGFFISSFDGEKLPARQKEIYDGAIPSGNSVMMLNLLKLSAITGRVDLAEKAQQISKVFSSQVSQTPMAYCYFMCGVAFALGSNSQYGNLHLVLAGNEVDQELQQMLSLVKEIYMPNKTIILRPSDESSLTKLIKIIPSIKEQAVIDGKATAYFCFDGKCELPIVGIEAFQAKLKSLCFHTIVYKANP